jgi:hypothetical protein
MTDFTTHIPAPPTVEQETAVYADDWTVTRIIATHAPVGEGSHGFTVTHFEIRRPNGELFTFAQRLEPSEEP